MAGSTLSDSQMILLMEVAGIANLGDNYGKTLGELLRACNMDSLNEEQRAALERVLADSALSSLSYRERNERISDGDHQMWTFLDAQGNPIIVFQGTQSTDDIAQDLALLTHADTDAQKEALRYVEEVYGRYRRPISAVGHSLGGNLAEYATILSPYISRCIALNAPGFCEAFMGRYEDEIMRRRHKVAAYNTTTDKVHDYPGLWQFVEGATVSSSMFDGKDHSDYGILEVLVGDHDVSGMLKYRKGADGKLHIVESPGGGCVADTGVVRDFRQATLNSLIGLIDEINAECPIDFTRWQCMYQIEDVFFKRLDPSNYVGDMRSYYRKVMDIHDTTPDEIRAIFEKAHTRDGELASSLSQSASDVKNLSAAMRDFMRVK